MNTTKLTAWLQNYNRRHSYEYHGHAALYMEDDCCGHLVYGEEIIPGTSFNNSDELESLLLNS